MDSPRSLCSTWIPVVAAGGIGGIWAGLPAAIGADLLVNFFFVPPYHTLLADRREHVIVLVVYILVATSVSFAIDLAARQRARAARRETEARLLATATAIPVTENTLTTLLGEIREAFGMQAVALMESHPTGELPAAHVGPLGDGRPTSLRRPDQACGSSRGVPTWSLRIKEPCGGWRRPPRARWRRSG